MTKELFVSEVRVGMTVYINGAWRRVDTATPCDAGVCIQCGSYATTLMVGNKLDVRV